MNKDLVKKIKEKLEKEKNRIEKELSSFAQKNKGERNSWSTKFPLFDESSTGSQAIEDAIGEVEDYVSKLPVEHALELRLKEIDIALNKIKKGSYGICEKCKKNIPLQRLKAKPEALFCIDCQK
jgi:DnaK suppressor protein